MIKSTLFFLAVTIPFWGHAQEIWDLRACIAYGLKNNGNAIIYQNDRKIADGKAKESLSAYLPSIGLTSTLDDNIKPQEQIIPAGLFGPTDLKVAFTKRYTSNMTAQLDQTVFDQSLIVGLKARKFNKDQAELGIVQSQESIIYNVAVDFYQIMIYREQLSILQANKKTYQRQMDLNEMKVKLGVLIQKDLDKIVVDFNNMVAEIVTAESRLRLAENQLKYDMGYPIRQPLTTDSLVSSIVQENSSIPQTPVDSATLRLRVDYQIAKTNIALLKIDEQRIKAGAYPKITMYARYGAVGFGDRLGQAYAPLSSFSVIGLKFNFPLLDFYKRTAQLSQARYQRANAEEKLKLDESRYLVESESARNSVIRESINTDNNQRNVTLARAVFHTTDLQYEKGTTDLADWLNSQRSLKESESKYLNSFYNYHIARLDAAKSNGTLLQFYSTLK